MLFGGRRRGLGLLAAHNVGDGVDQTSRCLTKGARSTDSTPAQKDEYAGHRHPARWRSNFILATTTATRRGRGSSRSRPYAPHSRVLPEGAFPGQAALPTGLPRPPFPPGHPRGGNCGLLDMPHAWASKDLPGFGDDLAPTTRPPAYPATGALSRCLWGEPRLEDARRRARSASCSDRARMVQSIDRMGPTHPASGVPPQHLRGAHL